jgi:2-dehydro-3-deoxygluconokinase
VSTPRYDVTTLGETMIRLSPAVGIPLEAAASVDLHVGGAESNVAVTLAQLGRRTGWFGAVSDNALGRLVIATLRGEQVDVTHARQVADARMGAYWVEHGGRAQPSRVIYDRAESAFTRLDAGSFAWDALLDTRVLHLTGITPALGPRSAEIVAEAVRRAAEAGVRVSFDVNYRARLWSPERARAVLRPLMAGAYLVLCGRADAATVFRLEGTPEVVARELAELTEGATVVLTLGEEGALLVDRAGSVHAVGAIAAEVVDGLGAGDAFAAGVIDGDLDGDVVDGLRRGAWLAAVALETRGDMVRVGRSSLLAALAGGGRRVIR